MMKPSLILRPARHDGHVDVILLPTRDGGRVEGPCVASSCCARFLGLFLLLFLSTPGLQAQSFTVTGSVPVPPGDPHKRQKNTGVVVWLEPLNKTAFMPSAKKKFTLLQKNKTFTPHMLVVPVGSEVEFPNKDPFFHNVFSYFEGNRFDLGLYQAGSSKSLPFDRPGISYLFCNIHSEMSAVIIALDTPYYATSDQAGQISIPDVPAGRYLLQVFREGVSPVTLKTLSRPITISGDSTSLGKLNVPNSTVLAHKNKYGKDYEDPTPPGQIYNDR
jgi:plastocyanin